MVGGGNYEWRGGERQLGVGRREVEVIGAICQRSEQSIPYDHNGCCSADINIEEGSLSMIQYVVQGEA